MYGVPREKVVRAIEALYAKPPKQESEAEKANKTTLKKEPFNMR